MTDIRPHEDKLESYHAALKDKRVVVLGGDDDIDWNYVKGFDFVARVNGHWQRQRGRCDILYYSCADDLDMTMFDDPALYDDLKFAWINGSHMLFNGQAQIARFLCVTELLKKRNIPMFMYVLAPVRAYQTFVQLRELHPRYEWARRMAERWSFHPLTGMAAVYHLANTPAHSIHINKISFYQKPDGVIPETSGVHDMASQMNFLREFWVEQAGRISLSRKLLRMLFAEDK
jgi:hypothetical protein